MEFKLDGQTVDSVELKCMVVSRGLKIDPDVYKKTGGEYRIYPNALTCNSFKLPDGTIVMATDLGFHMSTISSMFSWDNLKLCELLGNKLPSFLLQPLLPVNTLQYRQVLHSVHKRQVSVVPTVPFIFLYLCYISFRF